MPGRDIIVIGASAGGVEALKVVIGGLPADLPASVFVVLHVPPRGTSSLPGILSRNGHLPAGHAADGEALLPGRIYVAPPDMHLVLRRGTVGLARGPRENGHRPAVDALFRSAARSYGKRVVGVVLSGTLDDGAAGLAAIKQRGGYAIVQDPADAIFRGMPLSALRQVDVDSVRPAAAIAGALVDLTLDPLPEGEDPVPDETEAESAFAEFNMSVFEDERHPGTPSGFGCPDCGGALWELRDGELARFRCRVGHAWSSESLASRQSDALEEALWVALRALEERSALAIRLSERLGRRGSRLSARYAEQVAECRRQAALIREILMHPPTDVKTDDGPDTELEEDLERRPDGGGSTTPSG